MIKKYSNVRGTSDFDTSQSLIFREVSDKAIEVFKIFGYQEIILPLLEEKDLFAKGVGEVTDIVERQMFKIEGKDIVLRPEGTAQVVRYFLQNSLHRKSDFHKLFYIGPMFRGERPQKGRYRQFYHLGVEAIGSDSIYLDAEIIILCLKVLEDIGVKDVELKINSLGCARDKQNFAEYLRISLEANKDKLCDDCKRRLSRNPLRVLDCKNKECKKIALSLDIGGKVLCSDCSIKFKKLLSLLDDLGVKYTNEKYLVRGLDYYTNTVFEVTSSKLGSQDAIGAGGRYNSLVSSLGGPDIPAIGFALGYERISLLLETAAPKQITDIFIAVTDKDLLKTGFKFLNKLRQAGIVADCDYCDKSLKAQLRFAQKKGARFVLIVGGTEVSAGDLLLKDMDKSTQDKIKIENLISEVEKRIKKGK